MQYSFYITTHTNRTLYSIRYDSIKEAEESLSRTLNDKFYFEDISEVKEIYMQLMYKRKVIEKWRV